jgi:hypothetical protein
MLLLVGLTAAGCDSAPPSTTDSGTPPRDAGAGCPPYDGTPVGDCMAFSCRVNALSAQYCTGGVRYSFTGCEMITGFPEDYRNRMQTYFSECNTALETVEDTEVPVEGGTFTATRCMSLACALDPESRRLFMGMPGVIRAECGAVPTPACDFPDPPAP